MVLITVWHPGLVTPMAEENKGFYGPGFRRMRRRLGPKKLEALRQLTLEDQRGARAKWGDQPVNERDRTTYKDYPVSWVKPHKPKSKQRKK